VFARTGWATRPVCGWRGGARPPSRWHLDTSTGAWMTAGPERGEVKRCPGPHPRRMCRLPGTIPEHLFDIKRSGPSMKIAKRLLVQTLPRKLAW
jgi:hypothetical protein